MQTLRGLLKKNSSANSEKKGNVASTILTILRSSGDQTYYQLADPLVCLGGVILGE